VVERADAASRLRTLLEAQANGGSRGAALLIHSEAAGAVAIGALVRAALSDARLQGLPARVLALPAPDIGWFDIDLWLAAIAAGVSQVWILVTHEDAVAEREAIAAKMRVAQALLTSLGFAGEHFRIIGGGEVSRLVMDDIGLAPRTASAEPGAPLLTALQRLDRALQRPPASTVERPACLALQAEPRRNLELAVEQLRMQVGIARDGAALNEALAAAASLCGEATQ
jgi:hypothetical protein